MAEKLEQKIKKDIEKLLGQQTDIILSAVDEKFFKFENKFDQKLYALEHRLNAKLAESETRVNAKIDKLTNTLDKFLKRLLNTEDEFTAMKFDVNRIKKVIKEKLGVNLT